MKNIAGITLNPMWATMGTIAIVIAFLLTAWPALAQSAQPATPQNLQVIDKTHRSVTIGWDDPGDSSIAGYKILRRQIPIMAAGNFKVIEENTNSASTQYTDTEDYLEPNIQYVYRVQSVNADDALSGKSDSVRVRVPRWQAPQNVGAESTARDDGKFDVMVTWDSEHADTHLVTGYQVSRRVVAPAPESDFTELDRGRFSEQIRGRHVDSGVVWPRVYEYQVKAKTVNGSLGLPATTLVNAWATVSEACGEDLPGIGSNTDGIVSIDGAVATGILADSRDDDIFKTYLLAGHSYRVDLKGDKASDYGGTLSDPAFLLTGRLTGQPDVEIWDNNSGAGNNARIELDVHTSGIFLIFVFGGQSSRGTYSLAVSDITDGDLSGLSNNVNVVTNRQPALQNLEAQVSKRNNGDYDVELSWDDESTLYVVDGYRISRRIAGPEAEADFTVIAEGHHSGNYTDSDVSASNVYEYKVQAITINCGGLIGIPGTAIADTHETVSEASGEDLPDINSNTDGFVSIGGAAATGILADSRDDDMFKTYLVAGYSYRIDLKGDEASDYGGTLSDPAFLLTGQPDVVIWENNSGAGNNARLELDVQTSGIFLILVFGGQNSSGTYSLAVSNISD